MSESTNPEPRMQIRWGWMGTCVFLGVAGIAGGLLLTASSNRTAYIASVLAGIGTTLLLVGFVVLLERRIVESAATAVRRAVAADREATDERIDKLVRDLKERVTAEWEQASPDDPDARRRRLAELTDEATRQVVAEANEFAAQRQRDVG